MMNKISSCLKWTWSGGPSPGLCHATMTEVAPPVASVVRSTSMSRPKGLIDNACLGVTTAGCSGVRASMGAVSFYLVQRSCRRNLSRVHIISRTAGSPSEVEAEPPHPAVGGAAGRAPAKPVVPPLLGDGDRPRVLRPLPRHAGRGGSCRASDRPGPRRAARRGADELPHSAAQFPVWRTDCQVHGCEPGG